MIPPKVWLKPSFLAVYGRALDADVHSHQALQCVWPSEQSICLLNGNEMTGAFLINSRVEHRLQMDSGWLLLVEPQSDLGGRLMEYLGQQSIKTVAHVGAFSREATDIVSFDELSQLVQPLFLGADFSMNLDDSDPLSVVTDKRIRSLLSDLNRCLDGDCIKPASWKAAEVSRQLALSESRFLHVFREQMGIAWRPYLLWRRLYCAINALLQGKTATEAAFLAGFSDSAHLSRTFRNVFGVSIRNAKLAIQES